MAVINLDDHRRDASRRRERVEQYRREAPASWRTLLSRWEARRRWRRTLREELLPQPDSVLADAGLTREDAVREAAKPFWRA